MILGFLFGKVSPKSTVIKIDCHQTRLCSYEVGEYTYSIYSATGIDHIYERADNINL